MLDDEVAPQTYQAPRSVRWLQPRDARAAARTIAPLCIVAAVVTIAFAVASRLRSEMDTATLVVVIAAAGAVVALGWATRFLSHRHWVVWGSLPFLCIALIVALDLITQDRTVAAQVFFFFPALYAASRIPRPGSLLITAGAVAGDAVVVFAMSPFPVAVTDVGYVAAALVTASVLLNASAEQQEDLVARLRRQAAIDPLTGLVTRRVLDQAAQAALSGAASSSGTALILLDVDRFKAVNDEFGHPAGDEVLVQLAALLTRECRPVDVVSRLGGDEIALLLPGCSEDVLARRAADILAAVRAHVFALDGDVQVDVSITVGIAHSPTHALDLRSLYLTADAALYRAKRSGGDQIGHPAAGRVETADVPPPKRRASSRLLESGS